MRHNLKQNKWASIIGITFENLIKTRNACAFRRVITIKKLSKSPVLFWGKVFYCWYPWKTKLYLQVSCIYKLLKQTLQASAMKIRNTLQAFDSVHQGTFH